MKKLITILAIMIVLVSAVFATEDPNEGNTSLKVVTLVTVIEPTFKLQTTKAVSGVLGSAVPGVMGTVTSPDNNTTDAYHVINTNTLTSKTETETSVDFEIIQTRTCKSYMYYTFTVAATDLQLKKVYDNSGALVDFTPAQTGYANNQKFVCTTTAPDPERGTSDANIEDQTIAAGYKIKYNGVQVDEETQIATFTCTWTNNPEGMPGQYEATVTLTVAAN